MQSLALAQHILILLVVASIIASTVLVSHYFLVRPWRTYAKSLEEVIAIDNTLITAQKETIDKYHRIIKQNIEIIEINVDDNKVLDEVTGKKNLLH